MQRVHDNGHVYKGLYEGWYCPRCADFKTENEIAEGNTCPIHRIPLDRESEENWFFRLSAFQEQLEQLYAEQPDFVLPRQRYNEARAFITGGLNDVSLSRAKLTWGVEVPWDPAHVFYVWFDALLNYYTALSFGAGDGDRTRRALARRRFHDHRQGHPQVPRRDLARDAARRRRGAPAAPVHPRLPAMKDVDGRGRKMSKSLGNVLDPFEVMDKFGTDALRYYCFREVSFGQDGAVSTAGFESRYETELANDYGNLASRTIAMIARYRDGAVPDAEADAGARAPTSTAWPTRSPSCSTARRSRRRSSASGSACGG